MDVILESSDFKSQIKRKSYVLSHLDEADCCLLETQNMHRHSSPPSAAESDEESLGPSRAACCFYYEAVTSPLLESPQVRQRVNHKDVFFFFFLP